MAEQKYSNEQLLKVMLDVAQRKRALTNIEKKYYSSFDSPSESLKSEIIREMTNKGWICTHIVQFDNRQTFPYISTKEEGLSKVGEDKLKDLLFKFKEKSIEKRTKNIKIVLKCFFGVLTSLLVAYIVWKLGWNK